jgi:hypothetical protein
MIQDRQVTAKFSMQSFNLGIEHTQGGSVKGAGRFPFGTVAPIEASADEGFYFSEWTGLGVTNPSASTSSVAITENRKLTANFNIITHQLFLHSSIGGKTAGTGTFEHKTLAPVTASPSPGYSFSYWTGTGLAEPYARSTTVEMSSDRNITAHFSFRQVSSATDAIALGESWYSHWLGSVFESEMGWCYHLGFGWVFPVFDDNHKSVWIWLPGHEWIWTDKSKVSDSFFWSALDQAWRFYDFSQLDRLRFFRYIGESWTEE